MRGVEYEVWGGYEGEETGDYWGTFPTFDAAVAYKRRQEAGRPRLILHISHRLTAPKRG